MVADLVIKNARLVEASGVVAESLGVVIDQGRIQAIVRPQYLPESAVEIDATDKLVVPGLIDPHVHTRDPGYEYKEDLITCSAAAAAGGITLMLAMQNVIPPIKDVAALQSFQEVAAKRSIINFNCIGVLVEGGLDQIYALAEAGLAAIKVLMGYKYDVSAGEGRPDVVGLSCPSDGELLQACHLLAEAGLPLAAHAENDSIIRRLQAELQAKGRVEPRMHTIARPSVGEEEAVSRLITFAKTAGNRLHILHLASGRAMRIARDAQQHGVPVTIETCPHYLLMTHEDDVVRLGSIAKIQPPIRTAWDQEVLWGGIRDGTVTMIGTDHSPHTAEEKWAERPFDDIFSPWAGFIGVETSAPLLLTEVNRGRLSIERFVELYSTGPARTFGLYPDRGSLNVGTAADITVVDMEAEATIDAETLHSKWKVTPWHGWKVKGVPTHTIVNGKIVYREGEVIGSPGDGRFVPARHSRPSVSQSEAGSTEV